MSAAVSLPIEADDAAFDGLLRRLGALLPLEQLPSNEVDALIRWCSSFYPYQLDWMLDPSLFAICCKSRQIGMSHTTAAVGVFWAVFLGENTTFISRGKREAVEVLEKAKLHARALQDFGSEYAAMNGTNNQSHVDFATGARIIALPSSGGRSFTGNLFLDEFAYVKHASQLWDAALPTMMLGDLKARIVSTPNGAVNEFYDTWRYATGLVETPKHLEGVPRIPWSPHFIPLQRAINDGFPVDWAKCMEIARGDLRLFDQFFHCAFLDGELQYFPNALIEDCANDATLLPADGRHFAGLDIGKEHDLTVLVVLRVKGGKRHVVFVAAIRRTDSDALDALVAWAFKRFKLVRLQIDKNGLGEFPAERMKKRHSEKIDPATRRPRVTLNNFQMKDKAEIATSLFVAMTDQQLVLPNGDDELPVILWEGPDGTQVIGNAPGTSVRIKRELASIQRIVTSMGNIRYDAPRTSDGHADHAWALGLANHACDDVHPTIAALQKRMGIRS